MRSAILDSGVRSVVIILLDLRSRSIRKQASGSASAPNACCPHSIAWQLVSVALLGDQGTAR